MLVATNTRSDSYPFYRHSSPHSLPHLGKVEVRLSPVYWIEQFDLSRNSASKCAHVMPVDGLKIPVWAVQFCPPAPLGNTGLVSYGHKSFFRIRLRTLLPVLPIRRATGSPHNAFEGAPCFSSPFVLPTRKIESLCFIDSQWIAYRYWLVLFKANTMLL